MKTKVRNGKSLSIISSLLLFCVILLSCLIPGSAAHASSVDSVATVNGAAYATLSDAYAAAAGTAYPIILQKDVTASEFRIKAAVTMDLNGHTITAGSDAQMAFWIENGGSLTLSGTGTVEGGNQKFGIIYVAKGGSFTLLDNVTLTGNTATNGGAVYNFGTFSMKGGTISNTTATEYGGAVYNTGTFTMDGGIIEDSAANYGGAVYNYSNSKFTMDGGTISKSEASCGGAVYNYSNSKFTMDGGTISESGASSGGAVFNYGSFTMNGGDISDTTATCYGGAVYTGNAFTMKKGSITNAKVTEGYVSENYVYGGGGIYLAGGTAELEGGTISGCSTHSTKGYGGGVSINVGTTFTMSGGSISGCTIANCGGGVYNAGTFIMSDGSIFGNGSQATSGAGVYNDEGSKMTMSGGMIALNSGHGGVYSNGADVSVTGGAVFGNTWYNNSQNNLKTTNVDFFGWQKDKDQIKVIAASQMQTDGYSFENAKWRVHYYGDTATDVTDSLPSKQVTFGTSTNYLAYEAVDYTDTAAAQVSGIFLNGISGNDMLDGTSKGTAVQTFAKAKELAEAALAKGEKNVTIYVCGQVTVSGTETWSLPENVTLKRLDGYDGYLVSVPSKTTLTLKDITIDGNRPMRNGVNIDIKYTDSLLSVSGTLNIQDGAVLQNNRMGRRPTYYGGGAIYCNGGTVNMTGGVMRNNETDKYGGAIAMVGGTFNMSDGTIQNNRADFGGAVALLRGAKMTLKGNASIANNVAGGAGGIAVGGRTTDTVESAYGISTLTMTGGSISGNDAKAGSGGGIFVQANCKATISEGSITGNHAAGSGTGKWAGGGIYVNEQSTTNMGNPKLPDGVLQLYNVEIANNSAQSGGGLAACPTSNVKVVLKDGGVFHDNKDVIGNKEIFAAASQSATVYISDFMLGGGMYQWIRSDGTRAEQSYYQNTRSWVELSNICDPVDVKKAQSLTKVFITGNTADYNGGGIAANGTVLIGDTTNTESARITIEKHWNSETEANTEAEQQSRPDSVKVDIQYGSYTLRGIVLSKQNNWTVTLQNVPNVILAQTNPTVKVMELEFGSGWYSMKNVTATVKDNVLTISFTNTYAPHGDLTVQKTVSGVGADPLCAFHFTVRLSDKTVNGVYGDMTFTNGVAEFRLKHGQSATATGLPAGVTYTVSERTGSGYTASIRINGQKVMEAKGYISTDAANVVAFENIAKFHIPKTGDSTPLTLCLLLMLLSLSGAGFLWRKKS